MKFNKGELLLKALEIIEAFTYDAADFIDAFLSSSKSNYLALRNFKPKYHKTLAETIREQKQEKQQLYELLCRLKKQGLARKVNYKNKNVFKITQKGKEKKMDLQMRLAVQMPYKRYKVERATELVIITFDVLEKEKNKREWLRAVLKNFGFRMLQKSVWIGKVKIPTDFIEDLKKLNLLSSVEIFAVSKTGTIKQYI